MIDLRRSSRYGRKFLPVQIFISESFQEVESLPVCRGLKLGAMLPMETQRVTKYHLMFERILDYEPRKSEDSHLHSCVPYSICHSPLGDTENFQQLQRCYAKAKETAEFVNAEKRGFESFHKLAELQHRLENATSASLSEAGFSFQGRVYVFDGPLGVKMGNTVSQFLLFKPSSTRNLFFRQWRCIVSSWKGICSF